MSEQAVLQCLYSQCQTAQFGSALHHALSECSNYDLDSSLDPPHLIRNQGLRKRQPFDSGLASLYVSASGIQSVSRQNIGASGFAYSRTIRSTVLGVGQTHDVRNTPPTSLPLVESNVIHSRIWAFYRRKHFRPQPTGIPSRSPFCALFLGLTAFKNDNRAGMAQGRPEDGNWSSRYTDWLEEYAWLWPILCAI